jgi:hypothetical protein
MAMNGTGQAVVRARGDGFGACTMGFSSWSTSSTPHRAHVRFPADRERA